VSALAAALGYPPDARLLIVHQDDVGMNHGANRAFTELSRGGFLTCGSVMVPCPWFREIADQPSSDLDIGVHLTLTSEWPHYRWAPISTVSRASGLIDPDGYFWRTCLDLRAHVVPAAAEAEMRIQIERALQAGIDVTHLDTHMGAALVPELAKIYVRLGREYRLPTLLPRRFQSFSSLLALGDLEGFDYAALRGPGDWPDIDEFRMTPGVPSVDADEAYTRLVTTIEPGVTYLALHCNAPGDIEAIVPPRARWRTDEYRLFAGERFGRLAAEHGIRAIGMRAVRETLRGSERASESDGTADEA
jgi:chitin disaccharide deacetylase